MELKKTSELIERFELDFPLCAFETTSHELEGLLRFVVGL